MKCPFEASSISIDGREIQGYQANFHGILFFSRQFVSDSDPAVKHLLPIRETVGVVKATP